MLDGYAASTAPASCSATVSKTGNRPVVTVAGDHPGASVGLDQHRSLAGAQVLSRAHPGWVAEGVGPSGPGQRRVEAERFDRMGGGDVGHQPVAGAPDLTQARIPGAGPDRFGERQRLGVEDVLPVQQVGGADRPGGRALHAKGLKSPHDDTVTSQLPLGADQRARVVAVHAGRRAATTAGPVCRIRVGSSRSRAKTPQWRLPEPTETRAGPGREGQPVLEVRRPVGVSDELRIAQAGHPERPVAHGADRSRRR